jgi:NADH-quinone oxidoreductase subunit F
VEVPIGTPLGEVIYDIGDGIKDGKNFKAAQIGGPSGGCIPRQYLNVPLDYAPLKELGAIIGSGGLIVMDEDTCMVDMARFFLEFVQEESCGKCVPCRVGTKRMLEILDRICEGHGEDSDIDKLIELGHQIQDTALCGLGQTAPNPVLSTIRHFREEYIEHIRDHHCRAGVCPDLVRAPCQSGCPAGVDIPGFISLTGEKRYAEALKLHRERNPFAAVCARVCFHTCEDKCRRATIDQAVSVRGVKRFMVDQEITVQLPEVRENEAYAKRKIAIIGGGPAGLSCAYFLARLGYKPKIYEAEDRAGGLLVQAIPAYRLPRETLFREIRMIEGLGVDIETGKKLGRDFTLEDLRNDGYEAIFLATGATGAVDLGLPGEEGPGVIQSLPFLQQYNIKGSVPVKDRVVVVGGGNAAVDAARTAIRLGAKEVTLIYRRSRDEMPAYDEEIEAALHEGIILKDMTQPMEIERDANNELTGIKCSTVALGDFDKSGRRRPHVKGGKLFVIETQQIIIAAGQRLDQRMIDDHKFETGMNNFVFADPVNCRTNIDRVYAGGDVTSGPSSVVSAIASGEKAAVSMHQFFTGNEYVFWRDEKVIDTHFDPDSDPVTYDREKIHMIDVERRKNNFDEVEQSWHEAVAVRQSKRCLRCDYGKTCQQQEVAKK